MERKRGLFLEALLGFTLIAVAFGCGWFAYGHHHAQTRTFGVAVAAPYMIPRGFDAIGLAPTPQSTSFVAGDRVDLMIVVDDKLEPLILDALVTGNKKTNFGLLVREGERAIISHIRQSKQELIYRRSIVPSEAGYTLDFKEAQKELERLRAEGRVNNQRGER